MRHKHQITATTFRLLTACDVAEATGFNVRSLRDPRFRARHSLNVVRVGRALRFKSDAITAWLERAAAGVTPL